jgi:hypothetical protein
LRKNKPPGHPVGLPRAAKEVLGETPPEVKRFFPENDGFSFMEIQAAVNKQYFSPVLLLFFQRDLETGTDLSG